MPRALITEGHLHVIERYIRGGERGGPDSPLPGTAHLRNERNIAGARPASVSAEKLLRIASLLAGAAVGTDGALVFSDGRAPLPNPVILEGSIGELAERLARLGVLHCVAD